jgi:ABC-type uncharacterized transport system involved in gliding motility auxiliary subunit
MRRDYAKAAGWAALFLGLGTGVSYAIRSQADLGLWLPLALALGAAGFWFSVFRAEVLTLLRSRSARQGANSVFYALAIVVIAVLLQAFIANNDKSLDLSKDKAFTLADETVKTLKGLDRQVQILAFYDPQQRGAFEDLLKRAKKVNPGQFDYEFHDLNKEPLKAEQYGVRTFGTAVAVSGDKSESFNGSREEDLLNAVLKVSAGGKKQVYFLQGHQERSVDDPQAGGASELKKGLENGGFLARGLNFGQLAKAEVPEDAATLFIAGPHTDLLGPELEALTRYLGRGGRVVAALDPRTNTPGFKAWLSKAGASVDEDIVIDFNPFNQIFGGSPLAPVIQEQGFDPSHPITKDLRSGQGQAIFPQTRSVSLGKLPEGATGTVLAHSLPSAFGWMGSGNKAPNKPGPGDKKGPLDLAVAIEAPTKAFGGPDGEKRARLVVFGTSQFLANQLVVVFNNQDLVVNSTRWLADEEKRIALAPKPKENSPLLLDRGRMSMVWWSVLLMALGAAGMGVAVYTMRRRAA